MRIRKKTWPKLFKDVFSGKKNFDVRLADFDLKEGDILVFEEYNPETKKYTGRTIKKRVRNLSKIKVTNFNPIKDVIKYGHYVIELE